MARLPQISNQPVLTQAPQSSLSARDIASPLLAVADAFGEIGTVMQRDAMEDAQTQGRNAVTRAEDGTLQVAKNPFTGRAADVWEREKSVAMAARQQSDLRRDVTEFARTANGNVANFDASIKGYLGKFLKGVPQNVRGAFEADAEDVIGQQRVGLINADRSRQSKINAGYIGARKVELTDEIMVLARQGGTGTREFQKAMGDLRTLNTELTNNPDFAFGQGEADIELRGLASRAEGEAVVGNIDRILEKGGVPAAMRAVKEFEADTDSALSLAERKQYAGMMGDRIKAFGVQNDALLRPVVEQSKALIKTMKEEGTGFDNPLVDQTIATLQAGGKASEAWELTKARESYRAIAGLREPSTPLSDVVGAARQVYDQANGRVPVVTGNAVAAGRVGQADVANVQPDVMNRFQVFQDAFGASVPIMSGYRDPSRNAKAGGAKKSQHMHGNALDLDVSGMPESERVRLIEEASAAGFTGIGVYANSIHIDTGSRRVWGPSHGKESVPAWAQGAIGKHLSGGQQGAINRALFTTRGLRGDVRSIISDAATRNGVDPSVLMRIAMIESQGRPDAQNPGSSAGGLFQQTDGNAAQYGVANRFDAAQSAEGAARFAADNMRFLRGRLGREPTAGELYLAHQQGPGGALELLENPAALASDLVGQKAVLLNGGRADMTAAEFAGLWTAKMEGTAGMVAPVAAAAPAMVDPDVLDGYRDAVTENVRLTLDGWEDSFKRNELPPLADFQSLAEALPLVNNPEVRGRLTEMLQTTTAVQALEEQMPDPAQRRAYLDALNASMQEHGATVADRHIRDALQARSDAQDKALKDDAFAFVNKTVPTVREAWAGATDPQTTRTAIEVTAKAQAELGVQKLRLVPAQPVTEAVAAFASTDEALSIDDRMAPAARLVMASDNPVMQGAIFRQLVDAGLPEMTEGAFEALARGDAGGARRLFEAATFDPSKIPGKAPATPAEIDEQVQASIMNKGMVGDVIYGISSGTGADFAAAERDGKLIANAANLRMRRGEPIEAAVTGAARDLFGDVQVVTGDRRVNVQVTAPADADPIVLRAGMEAMLPRVRRALEDQETRMAPSAAPQGPTPGLMERGNIDLATRPRAKTADGSTATVRSMSFEEDGEEVLVPTVSPDGQILSDDEALDLYRSTGQHLGKFASADDATAYAERLHEAQERFYDAQAMGAEALRSGVLTNASDAIMAEGVFRNAGGGFAFVNPYSGLAIADAKGRAIIFSPDEVLAAGRTSQGAVAAGTFVGRLPGPAAERPSRPASRPLSQPDSGLGIRDALMGEETAPVLTPVTPVLPEKSGGFEPTPWGAM